MSAQALAKQSSAMDSIGQTSVALFAVLVLVVVCVWALRKLGWQRNTGSRLLRVLEVRSFGPRERIAVLEVGGEWLVVGVTAQQISLLSRLPVPALGDKSDPDAEDLPSFGEALAHNLAHFGRKRR